MKVFLKYVLPFFVVALGVGAFMALLKSRPEPPRTARTEEGLLVEVSPVVRETQEVAVDARGQVIPAQRVIISPQVTGTVSWMAENLVPGGRFERGATLFRLDARDYRLNLESQQSNLSSANLELQLERGRQVVAEREWQVFGAPDDSSEAGRALARREPQLENAEVSVAAAESGVERARLDLSRTRVTAPFNAMVLTESVDRGQLVGPTSQVVTMVGTDAFWVEVAIPVAQLSALRIPGAGAEEGSAVVVRQAVGGQTIERSGRVLRLLPDLDPAGSMARLLVEIADPLEGSGAGLPLLLGSYVEVAIAATPLEDVVEVPRYAVREGNRAFVMNDADELEVRELTVVWGRQDTVLVSEGLEAGEQLITSRVPSPVPGLKLRTRARREAAAEGEGG
ncbi:MAG: efflux RND transporter periplasmic adaptor subunit [Myxococcota bacterium]